MKGVSFILFLNIVIQIVAMDQDELRMKFIYGEPLKPSEIDALKKSHNGNLAPLLVLKRDIGGRLSPAEEVEVNKWDAVIAKKYAALQARQPLQ